MCDACSTSTKFKSAPGTRERMAELDKRTQDRILEFGQEITGVSADPMFYYTSGRSVFDLPELYLTGNLPYNTAGFMLNHLNRLERDGRIDIASLADGQEHWLDGFGCAFKFVEVDAYECEMFGATNIAGPHVPAYQVIWPDAQGRWPEDPEYAYGAGAQPIHAKR